MLHLNNYDVYIFDCDGVIFDSNQLKIKAMHQALLCYFNDEDLISKCIEYFSHNFGKSRFHHISFFLNEIFKISEEKKAEAECFILDAYSNKCYALYLEAEITPGFLTFLKQCHGKKYVASGSEQGELRKVLVDRELYNFFDGVFGSPTEKAVNVGNILKNESSKNAVMIGDAISDMKAAECNNIDFVFYAPYSNVKKQMKEMCTQRQYIVLDSFNNVRINNA